MGTRLPRHGCHRFSPLRFQERSLPGPPFGKPYCSAHSDASFPTSRFPLRCRSISASAGAFPSRRLRRFARRSSHAANDMRFPSGLPAPALTAGARCVSPDSKNRDSSPRAPGFRLPRTVRASRPKPLRVCRPAPCRRVDVRFFSAAQRPSQATAAPTSGSSAHRVGIHDVRAFPSARRPTFRLRHRGASHRFRRAFRPAAG